MPKVRNAHGTRVARAIVCSSCGAKDTVDFAPRNKARALCRACAVKLLGVEDADAGLVIEQTLKCTHCGREEKTTLRDAAEFLCKDCHRGIYSRQQDRSKRAARVAGGKVLRVKKPAAED